MRHLDFLQRFPLKTIGWKNWVQKLLEVVKTPNKPNQKTKNPIVRTGRLVLAEQPFGSHAQEINKRVFLACESTNVRTGRRVSSCVPVSVERLDQDKDGDEKVDADQVRTGRPVESEQSIGFVHTARGNRHCLQSVWIATCSWNFRVRELVKKIESHPHRQALQADLQQSNAYNPFSDESKEDDSWHGQCRVVRVMRNNSMLRKLSLLESRNSLLHLWTSLERKRIQPTCSPMATGCFLNPALRHQKGATSWCSVRQKLRHKKKHFVVHNARRRCIKKKFKGLHDRFQRNPVYRDSQLKVGWTEEKCIEMDKLAQENHSYCTFSKEYERYQKNW